LEYTYNARTHKR